MKFVVALAVLVSCAYGKKKANKKNESKVTINCFSFDSTILQVSRLVRDRLTCRPCPSSVAMMPCPTAFPSKYIFTSEAQNSRSTKSVNRFSLVFQVSLQVQTSPGRWFHFCGGSVYNAKTIITAAHCIMCVSLDTMKTNATRWLNIRFVDPQLRKLEDSSSSRRTLAEQQRWHRTVPHGRPAVEASRLQRQQLPDQRYCPHRGKNSAKTPRVSVVTSLKVRRH